MKDMDSFKPWELKWEVEHIQRFWNWWASTPALEYLYFSNQVGDPILDEISLYIRLTGTVVDVGSGPGYIVSKLLQRGINTLAVDVSAESVNRLNERLSGNSHFMGARLSTFEAVPIDDFTADVVLLIETIEHLDDKALQSILSEILRITKRGGYIAVTTPNEENLAEHQVICPNCGCVFHTMQHIRSFSADSLRQVMQAAGFTEIVCRPTLFSYYPKLFRLLHRLKYKLKEKKLPHLLYIGQKLIED